MRWHGEPHCRSQAQPCFSRMLACGLCAIDCREAGVPLDHAGATYGVCPARASILGVRASAQACGPGHRALRRCCARQVTQQGRVAEANPLQLV